jgi:hypothetical protein
MQTEINPEGQPLGRAGQAADNADVQDIASTFNAEASAGLGFGLAVTIDDSDPSGRGVLNLTAITDKVGGIVAFDFNHQPGVTGDLDTDGNIKPGGNAPTWRKGRLLVTVEEAVNPDDRLFVRAVADVAGGLTVIGSCRKSLDPIAGPLETCIDLTKVGVYRTAAAAGGLAVLEVDFTNKP